MFIVFYQTFMHSNKIERKDICRSIAYEGLDFVQVLFLFPVLIEVGQYIHRIFTMMHL